MNKKLDFIIIGAMKSGTTSIVRMLNQHPGICISSIKEPMYFLQNEHSLVQTEAQLMNLFEGAQPDQLLGEASTVYTFYPEYKGVAERIYNYNPNIKLLYVLRDPVKRIESHYAFRVSRGLHKSELASVEVFEDEAYINRSSYAKQTKEFLKYFPKDQLKLVLFEDFLDDKTSFFNEIFDYLGIEKKQMDTDIWANKSEGTERINPTGTKLATHPILKHTPAFIKDIVRSVFTIKLDKKPELDSPSKSKLKHVLKEDIEFIENYLERDLSVWK